GGCFIRWLSFYHREYKHVGFVIGRYYTATGQPTETLLQVEASLAEGRRLKVQTEADNARFPPCNSEWSASSGGRVWCSTKRDACHLLFHCPLKFAKS
uniref:Uncharacterized protein n=1 Tax=Neogobius melanostomus TaxID=47308 RepID=A0A8C6TUQ3_9GOBI